MKFLKLLLIVLFLISCTGEGTEDLEPSPFSGNWELIRVNCYCYFPVEIDFTKTKIQFINGKKELVVRQEANEDFFALAGTYEYVYKDKQFSLKNTDTVYEVLIEGEKLTITSIEDPRIADAGVQYVFKAF